MLRLFLACALLSRAAEADAVERLQAANAAMRAEAAREIGRGGARSYASLSALLDALSDPDPTVRHYAAVAVVAIDGPAPEALPQLVEGLSAGDWHERWACALAVARFGAKGAPAVETLVAALRDPERELRSEALIALGHIGPPAAPAAPAMAEVLGSRYWQLRMRAAYALARLGPSARAAAPILAESLRDPHPEPRAGAVEALGRIGFAAMPAILAKDDGTAEYHAAAQRAVYRMVRYGTATEGQILNAGWATTSADPGDDGRRGVPYLQSMLHRPPAPTRAAAARALGSWREAARWAIPALLSALAADEDVEVRAAAAEAIGRIASDEPGALRELGVALGDPEPAVRARVVHALARLRPADAGRTLAPLLDDPVPRVRLHAVRAYRRLGAVGLPALDRLKRMHEEAPPPLRREIRLAIAVVEGDLPAETD